MGSILTTQHRPSVWGLALLLVVAALATLPLGCAAPAFRDLAAALSAFVATLLLLRPTRCIRLLLHQRILLLLSAFLLPGHAYLAGQGYFPDATAVWETLLVRLAFFSFLAVAIHSLSHPLTRRIFASTAAGVAVFQVFAGLLTLVTPHAPSANRLHGTFSSANALGGFLAILLPVFVGWFPRLLRDQGLSTQRIANELRKGSVRRVLPAALLLFTILIILAGLLLTSSRGALAAAFAGCLLAISPLLRTRVPLLRILLPAGGVLLFAILIITGGRFIQPITRLGNLLSNEDSLTLAGRPAIWSSLAPLLREHPLGVGAGSVRILAHAFQPPELTDARLLEAHSDPFELILEFGFFPGLFLLLVFAVIVFPPLFRAPTTSPGIRVGMAGAVLAGLLHSLVDFNLLWRPGVSLWFLLCLAGILPTSSPPAPRRRPLAAVASLLLAVASAWLSLQYFHAEWWRERAGGWRDNAMLWIVPPFAHASPDETIPLPDLRAMTADAAARRASANILQHDRQDRNAWDEARLRAPDQIPATGNFYFRQFRWAEHRDEYANLVQAINPLLARASGNADLRLVRDVAAMRVWLTESDGDKPMPELPIHPDTTSRLLRIRSAYAGLWLDACRRDAHVLPIARDWLIHIPETNPDRIALEEQNADILPKTQ